METYENDRRELFPLIVILLLVCVLLSSCGLGDGTYQLPNDYCLIHVNGHCIKLATREWTEGESISFYTYHTAVPNFFVKKVCNNSQYIGLLGIVTKSEFATAEELESGQRAYYLVDTESGSVYGCWDTESAFMEQCRSLDVGELGEWIETRRIDFAEE